MADDDDDDALKPLVLLRRLDGIERAMTSMGDGFRRELQIISASLVEAKDNDERFKKVAHDFAIAKWISGIALAAALVAAVQGIAAHFSLRITDAPVASSNADRLGVDRVAKTSTP